MVDFSLSYIFIGLVIVLALVFLKMTIVIVPQSQNYLIERLGKYVRKCEAGLHIIVPFIELVSAKIDVLERQLPSTKIPCITLDNVTIYLDLAILYRIVESDKTFYRVRNLQQAIITTVTGTVRNVIGRTDLDGVQSNRRNISDEIERELAAVSEEWGIVLTRVEILDVEVDAETKSAMQLQLNAERNRRALVREAEGKKQSMQLIAEAELYSAQKLAEAKKLLADAEAYAVTAVSKAISEGGEGAINFEMRKIQAEAVKKLGESAASKIVIMPTDVLDSVKALVSVFAKKQ